MPGQAFATYFSGDPGWIYGIQWLPVSPLLEYLTFDTEFARWMDGRMIAERQAWLDRENPKRAAEARRKIVSSRKKPTPSRAWVAHWEMSSSAIAR